jgi:hypothetical protein
MILYYEEYIRGIRVERGVNERQGQRALRDSSVANPGADEGAV